jgi:general secretion pathway protein H
MKFHLGLHDKGEGRTSERQKIPLTPLFQRGNCRADIWAKNPFQGGVFVRSLLGFTMLELIVVVALMAGLIAIAIPTIRSLGSLDLKSDIVKIAGLSSEVYALASISGKTHRIVFDLDEQKYWVEEKVGDAGQISPELGYEDLMKAKTEKKDEQPADKYAPSFKDAEGYGGEKNALSKNLVIHGVWTEEMNEVARAGKVAIYFFQGGYTQSAFVSLAIKGEEEGTSMYMSLNPLTAAVEIKMGEPDTKDLLSVEGEK